MTPRRQPPTFHPNVRSSPDNQYLYNLGGLQSFSINRFDASGNGVAYKSQTILKTTADGAGTVGKYNFLGLVGYDIR